MERIVSLLPAATEIACALGLGERLVGRSHECDHPPEVARLPVCTVPRFDTGGDSREIDARVRRLLREGLSIYAVDAGRLRALRPDAILTQDQCAVCAVTPADLERALARSVGAPCRVLSLSPRSLADVLADLQRVAHAAGVPARGAALAAGLTDRITAIGERSGGLASPRVACLEWLDPPMGPGHWMPELIALAGGRNLFGSTGARSERLDAAALVAADPDVLIAWPCGFGLERARAELAARLADPGLARLNARRAGRVFAVDGNAFMNRPGPRLVESLEILAEILHPEVFAFGHEGTGFLRLEPSA